VGWAKLLTPRTSVTSGLPIGTARYSEQIAALGEMIAELDAIEVDTSPYEVTIAKPNAVESDGWLYSSDRAYLVQIQHCKAHKTNGSAA
jgi:hypothetical protein